MIIRGLTLVLALLVSQFAYSLGWERTPENTGLARLGISCDSLPLYTGPANPAANTTITLQRIEYPELILANGGITLDRVCVRPTSASNRMGVVFGYNPDTGSNQLGDVTILDSDIDMSLVSNPSIFTACGFRGAGSVYRTKIWGGGNGICYFGAPGVNVSEIVDNLVYQLRGGMYGTPPQQSHNESGTVRSFAGTRLVWRGNKLISLTGSDSGALFNNTIDGDISNFLIADNYFETTAWNLAMEAAYGNTYRAVQALNNRFVVPPGGFGAAYHTGGPGWTVWADNYRYNAGAADAKGIVVGCSGGNCGAFGTAVTSPAAGATVPVNVTTTVTATHTATTGTVSQVVIKAGSTVICTDTTAPYSCSWTPTATGSVNLSSESTDTVNGLIIGQPVNVTVTSGGANAPPTASITAPANGASFTAGSTITVTATAGDSDGTVSQVVFKANGTTLCTDTTAPYSCAWTPTAIGSVALTAEATDNNSAMTASSAVNVTVTAAPDTTPPSVSLSTPANGATVSSAISVAATATDNVAVVGVQFRLNGANLGAEDATAPYSVTWDTTTAANGPHTLVAVARDAAGNLSTSSARTVTVNNPTVASSCAPITLRVQ
jgi:hypothetical protein